MRPRERRISVPARQPSAPPGRARSAPPGCGGLRIPRVAILLPAGRAHPLWECMALRSRLIPTARALPVRSDVATGRTAAAPERAAARYAGDVVDRSDAWLSRDGRPARYRVSASKGIYIRIYNAHLFKP